MVDADTWSCQRWVEPSGCSASADGKEWSFEEQAVVMLGGKEVALKWDIDANEAEQCHNAMSEMKNASSNDRQRASPAAAHRLQLRRKRENGFVVDL